MNGKELLEGMSFIDDQYVHEAEQTVSRPWRRWVAVAACICIVFSGVLGWFVWKSRHGEPGPGNLDNWTIAGTVASTTQSSVSPMQPPENYAYFCNSFEELAQFFMEESEKYDPDDPYAEFQRVAGEVVEDGLVIPYLDGEPIRFTADYNWGCAVNLYKRDWLDRPGIYLHYSQGERTGLIRITLLSREEAEMAEGMDYSEFLRTVKPNYANVNNWTEHYSNVYATEIELSSCSVSAIVLENGDQKEIQFVQNGAVIMLRSSAQVFTDEWLKRVDFIRDTEIMEGGDLMGRKMWIAVLACVLIIVLCACTKNGLGNKSEGDVGVTCACGPHDCEISAQYIRTNGTLPGAEYPVVTVISSREELDAYYAEKRAYYSMDSFLPACEKYDDAYFASKQLVLIALEENSSSISHAVTSVQSGGGCKNWEITIRRTVPGVLAGDMAQWHILVEVEPRHEMRWTMNANVTIETDGG